MIIRGLCPNCGGPISEDRLLKGLPCIKCLPKMYEARIRSRHDLRIFMESIGKVNGLLNVYLLEDELKEFEDFFSRFFNMKLWSIQRSWAKRILSGESFALVAPTGVGKTTLLQAFALYKARKGKKVLYIVPTVELMNQVISRLSDSSRNTVKIVNSREFKDIITSQVKHFKEGFVVVTTHAFLHKNKDLFSNLRFDLIIVDDFDALMKSSSILDLILHLLGISDKAISLALKLTTLKHELMFYKVLGNEDKLRKLQDSMYEAELELTKMLDYSKVGQLLIASATGRARGSRAKILRELLRFEVGSILDYMRNIIEVVEPINKVRLEELMSRLKGGTLIFVSKDLGMSKANEVVELLRERGFKVELAKSRKSLDRLRKGEVDILVGISTYYGILTRGIDEPERIFNVVFIGIPKFTIPLRSALESPLKLVRITQQLKRRYECELSEDEKRLVNVIRKLSPAKVRILTLSIKRGIELKPPLNDIAQLTLKVRDVVEGKIKSLLKSNGGKLVLDDFIIVKRGNETYIEVPDVMTYIQASGRSSRLYKGHMTLGLSILLYDDEDLLQIFIKRLKHYVTSFNPLKLNDVDLKSIQEEQVRSRAEVGGKKTKILSALIVVESPTKARTIARMFGTPGRRYLGEYIAYETVITLNDNVIIATIAPTLGHIYDLVVDEGFHGIKVEDRLIPIYTTIKRCRNCGYQFTDEVDRCPRCGSPRVRSSSVVVNALRKLAQEVDVVILATDPDEEGEKIAYDVYLTLRPYINRFYRVEFHEVTKSEFLRALKNPRQIDLSRVNAQIVRRVDDRFVGFELSSILKTRFKKHWLGGGRVQTPVLKWIVKRYEEYLRDKGYAVIISANDDRINLKLKYFTKDRSEAYEIAKNAQKLGIRLVKVNEEERIVNPKPPYTTDTLLSDASKALKLPPTKIMRIAQDLFELGFITYHRTDSTHVSHTGVEIAKEYLSNSNLSKYFTPRSWGGKGTHECIRPTHPIDNIERVVESRLMNVNITHYHLKLYELIFKRFIASQMKSSKVRYAVLDIFVGHRRLGSVEVPIEVIEEGHTVINGINVFNLLKNTTEVKIKDIKVKVIRTSKTPLHTVSDIIKLMKDNRIGRPSTYAKAVENNLRHGYVIISKRRLNLIPTRMGIEVCRYIESRYPELTSTDLTRELENIIEFVRQGKLNRDEALVLVYSDVARLRLPKLLSVESLPTSIGGTKNESATYA